MDENERIQKLEELRILRKIIRNNRSDRNKAIACNVVKWAPATIIAGVFTIAFVQKGDIPGHIDYIKKCAHNTVTYSSLDGDLKYDKEYKYGDSCDEDNVLVYYDPWEQQEDGTYISSVKTYTLKDIDIEQLEELSKKDDVTIGDLLDLNIKKSEEINRVKDSLTQEDLENDYYEIIVNYVDKNDVIKIQETHEENVASVATVCAGVIAIGVSEIIAHLLNGKYESISYASGRIKECKKKEKVLKKELKK